MSTVLVLGAGMTLAVSGAVATPAHSAPAAAGARSATACATPWGSQRKTVPWRHSVLTDVRAGRHACFDRLVLDGARVAYVSYVDQVTTAGSGHVVPVRGGARLQIGTSGSVADGGEPWEQGFVPANPAEIVDVTGWQTFRQVAHAGEFEGILSLGLGVRARLPFRVFLLSSPGTQPRVVIDVAHRW